MTPTREIVFQLYFNPPQSGHWKGTGHRKVCKIYESISYPDDKEGNTVDGKQKSPQIGPFKSDIYGIRGFVLNVNINVRFLFNSFWAFPQGPGGFRELREAYRKHFHLSWYL